MHDTLPTLRVFGMELDMYGVVGIIVLIGWVGKRSGGKEK
jgi:hypothetical protein